MDECLSENWRMRLFRKHLCKYISNHLTHKKFLCEQHCGFNNGLSIYTSVAKLLKHVHDGLDANKLGKLCFH